VILPLQTNEIADALVAATKPADRLALAPTAVHAARPKAIREFLLDDLDLGNRRLIVAGRTRPLDERTRHAILDWLDYRRSRWPNTANHHMIINQQTALETGPISGVSITKALRGQAATLERLRGDRQLDEALTRGPDPLHLAGIFGQPTGRDSLQVRPQRQDDLPLWAAGSWPLRACSRRRCSARRGDGCFRAAAPQSSALRNPDTGGAHAAI
jgi:hypothetical protein